MKKLEMVNSILVGLRKYEELHKTDQQRKRLCQSFVFCGVDLLKAWRGSR